MRVQQLSGNKTRCSSSPSAPSAASAASAQYTQIHQLAFRFSLWNPESERSEKAKKSDELLPLAEILPRKLTKAETLAQ